jgi:hypothetical protein
VKSFNTQDTALLALVPMGEENAMPASEIVAKVDWINPRAAGAKLTGLMARMTDPWRKPIDAGVTLHHKPGQDVRLWWKEPV